MIIQKKRAIELVDYVLEVANKADRINEFPGFQKFSNISEEDEISKQDLELISRELRLVCTATNLKPVSIPYEDKSRLHIYFKDLYERKTDRYNPFDYKNLQKYKEIGDRRFLLFPEAIKDVRFDALELSPVRFLPALNKFMERGTVEVCEESEADFFSVYVHLPNEGVQCIGDFIDKTEATDFHNMILWAGQGFIRDEAFGFNLDDIIEHARENFEVELTDEQAKRVQEIMIKNGDVGQGVSWETVSDAIRDLIMEVESSGGTLTPVDDAD